jgi:hypothetical protein
VYRFADRLFLVFAALLTALLGQATLRLQRDMADPKRLAKPPTTGRASAVPDRADHAMTKPSHGSA